MQKWPWHQGIPGLTLNFDFLRRKGVAPAFLAQWEDGVALGGDFLQLQFHRNHRSVTERSEWVEREWSRLEAS